MTHTVVFDLGGVLVRLNPAWTGLNGLDREKVRSWLAMDGRFHDHERGELSDARFLDGLRHCAEAPVSPEQAHDAFARCIAGHYDGATALLDDLRNRGIRTACLSNTNPIHWSVFDPDRVLRDRLDVVLASHHLGARKPEPRVFARAAAILGEGPVWFFDDSDVNVDAARSFGWKAFPVDPTDPIPKLREALSAL
jgi:putative hydrolase of the HAD superfamily